MKTVVVAGGAGLIGKAITERLKKDGYNTIVADPKNLDYLVDLSKQKVYDWLFNDLITGFVNAAYPKGFEEHTKFFMYCTEQFASRMKFGSIVNLASIYGIRGPDDDLYLGTDMKMPAWYAAAKGAIIAHSLCLAVRYAPNIRINCVSPGGVYDNQHDTFVDKYQNKVPMNRMASPRDVAGVVTFLLSDDASYITGQNIVVDGGITAKI